MPEVHRGPTVIVGLLLVLVTAGIIFVSCADKVTSPPPPEQSGEYSVWLWDGNRDGMYYNYTPETGRLDSLLIPDILPVYNFSVSSDGTRLYMEQTSSTAIVDAVTGELLHELPYRASNGYAVAESPLGDVMAVQCQDGLRLVDPQSYALLFEDTLLDVKGSWFTADGDRMYCSGTRDTVSGVFIVDLANQYSITEAPFTGGSVSRMRPSPDESTWYILRDNYYTREFQVYDVDSGAVTFEHTLLGGRGEIEMTPDGQYVFISEPGAANDGVAPSHFLVYDVAQQSIDSISTVGCQDGTNPIYLPIDDMAITPDGKWLVAGEGIAGDSFLRFNLETMAIDSYYQFPKAGLGTYGCQVAE